MPPLTALPPVPTAVTTLAPAAALVRRRRPRRVPALGLLALLGLLTACATPTPVVYPKAPATQARPEKVQADIARCRAQAEAAVGLNQQRVAEGTAQAGAIGFVAGAVASLVAGSRDIANKAAAGAAGGATGVATKLLFERHLPDEVHREYVERCLREKGHDVLGWR